jgi:hypothetical protein
MIKRLGCYHLTVDMTQSDETSITFIFETDNSPVPNATYPRDSEDLGSIDLDYIEGEFFICLNIDGELQFFYPLPFQHKLIRTICKSSKRGVQFDKFIFGWGYVKARLFKYLLNGVPVIGYLNDKGETNYIIPMEIYGNPEKTENRVIYDSVEEREGRFTLYDQDHKPIVKWPIGN